MADFPNEHTAKLAKELQGVLSKTLDCGIVIEARKTKSNSILIDCSKTWFRGSVLRIALLQPVGKNPHEQPTIDIATGITEIKTGFYTDDLLFRMSDIHAMLSRHYPHAKILRDQGYLRAAYF